MKKAILGVMRGSRRQIDQNQTVTDEIKSLGKFPQKFLLRSLHFRNNTENQKLKVLIESDTAVELGATQLDDANL